MGKEGLLDENGCLMGVGLGCLYIVMYSETSRRIHCIHSPGLQIPSGKLLRPPPGTHVIQYSTYKTEVLLEH